ncbi:MAG: type III-A CRISPR-associated RAMP protein Csm3 [Thermodesulfovibrio sp.]|nr:type III-A CRISPR-associated RAMP protein Csm3 [Thermodesulfovibrio sp.]MDW7998474.1 type III-A CRISPR-associated RAMP protein Csm3 [Thermodesulfovibrio sp.]
MKLIGIKEIKGKIILKSGLHIGSGNMEMKIGGTDSPVIKHPHTLEPYIPGSSLKGKVRSLLELESGLVPFASESGGLVTVKVLKSLKDESLRKKAEAILKIFGSSGSESDEEIILGPTRVSFADCYLNKEWKEKAQAYRWQLIEVKAENSMDRIRGTVSTAGPRFIERVPEGTEFDFTITFKILEDGDETLFEYLLKGLKLLEMDSIGGNGSRGYGRIKFEFNDDIIKEMFDKASLFYKE